jgi:hypothetical protein
MKLLKSLFLGVYVTWLAVVGLYALALLVTGTEAMLSWAGVALAALPLLLYLVIALARRQPRAKRHPVGYSVASGLGLVITMITSYRFGDAAGDLHLLAGITVIGWVLYLRWYSA